MINVNRSMNKVFSTAGFNSQRKGGVLVCNVLRHQYTSQIIQFYSAILYCIRVAEFHAFAQCLWNPRGENQDSNGHRPIRDSLAHCYAMYISLFSGCSNIDNNLLGALRDILLRKYCFSFGFCANYLTLASPPIWTACTTFSRCRNSRFERQFRTKITICTICCTIYTT